DGGHDEESVQGRHGFARRHVRWQDGWDDGRHARSLKMDPKQLEQMARQAGINPDQLKGLPGVDVPAPKALPTDVNALLKSSGGPVIPGLGGAPRFPGLPGLGKKK